MHTIQWHIIPQTAPEIIRHCKTCGADRPFVSSGLFRVNANHHILDIWLIHRCAACGRTWNMEIHERVHPKALDPSLLHAYQVNDPGLAARCAHDMRLHRRAGVRADYAGIPLIIGGPIPEPDVPTSVLLRCEQPMNLRVQRVLREKLALSSAGLKRLCTQGLISCRDTDILKARLSPGLCVAIMLPKAVDA